MNEKNKQFLLYILKKNPKTSITGLMKLLYLVDLISVKRTKKQISSFEYRRFHYGPFDKNIYQYIEDLVRNGFVVPETDYGATHEEFNVYSVSPEREGILKFSRLEESERGIIDELLNSVKGYGAKMLTEIAYKTKPMKILKATIGGSEHLGVRLRLQS